MVLGLLQPFLPMRGRRSDGGPIGVDLGASAVRLAQCGRGDGPTLVAAASRDLPPHADYAQAAGEAMRDLIADGGFAGRRAVLGLPAARQTWLHLRVPKLDAKQTAEAVRFEVEGRLPFPAAAAALRHHVVGEVHTPEGPRQEVLVTAVPKADVEALLSAAERAKLEVVAAVTTPVALAAGFGRLYRRRSDVGAAYLFVDLGRETTRAAVIRDGTLLFGRIIPLAAEPANLDALADELGRCRRHHEATNPDAAIDRLVFVGGRTAHDGIWKGLAQRLNLAAQVGDLVTRLVTDETDPEVLVTAGIDRRRPSPEWSAACGLALCGTGVVTEAAR